MELISNITLNYLIAGTTLISLWGVLTVSMYKYL